MKNTAIYFKLKLKNSIIIKIFSAVQHERAPRSSQSNLHHYPINMSTRLRSLHGSSFFSAIPFHLQTPLSVADPTSLASGALHAPYVPHGVLYPGIVGNFTKSSFFSGNYKNVKP